MKRKIFNVVVLFLAALAVLSAWELGVRYEAQFYKAQIIPAPSQIVDALIRNAGTLITEHIPVTMTETLIGIGIALIVGVGLAALLDVSPFLRRVIYPLLVISQTIPIIAIAPLLILIFDFGIGPKIMVVALFCFFPITIAMLDGLESADPDLLMMVRALGSNSTQLWRVARLPAALPSLFSGLRIAATYSVTGAITGEFITSQDGLGQFLRSSYNAGRVDEVFAAIIITAVLSVALVLLVNVAAQRALPYLAADSRRVNWKGTRRS